MEEKSQSKQLKESQNSKVNGKVFEWFCLVHSKNLSIIGPLLKERTLMFANELGHNNLYLFFLQTFQEFVASDGG